MINDHMVVQSHLIDFIKTFYSISDLTKKIKSSLPKPSIQTHHKKIRKRKIRMVELLKFPSKSPFI